MNTMPATSQSQCAKSRVEKETRLKEIEETDMSGYACLVVRTPEKKDKLARVSIKETILAWNACSKELIHRSEIWAWAWECLVGSKAGDDSCQFSLPCV
ncbi:hypothetical protein SAY87_012375 [Trapa incisa]|uniref:Uncharacterized protein n=1 Tax=Trapa incisa TaxID=236973 RepID=A0AAN7JK39_9MYRT|nr:hypothetical protein SAY87_012375 [Trapa incisa]